MRLPHDSRERRTHALSRLLGLSGLGAAVILLCFMVQTAQAQTHPAQEDRNDELVCRPRLAPLPKAARLPAARGAQAAVDLHPSPDIESLDLEATGGNPDDAGPAEMPAEPLGAAFAPRIRDDSGSMSVIATSMRELLHRLGPDPTIQPLKLKGPGEIDARAPLPDMAVSLRIFGDPDRHGLPRLGLFWKRTDAGNHRVFSLPQFMFGLSRTRAAQEADSVAPAPDYRLGLSLVTTF